MVSSKRWVEGRGWRLGEERQRIEEGRFFSPENVIKVMFCCVVMEEFNRQAKGGQEEENKGVQRKNRQQQFIGPTRLSAWLHNYYDIYLIETKGQQRRRLLPTHPSLQPKLAGRRSDGM